MVGIILAAGDGTRLKSSKCEASCKPLITLKGKALITFALDNLIKLNINEAFVVIGKEGDLIKEAIGNQYKSLNLHYVYQKEQKGLMNAFIQALSLLDGNEPVILQLSDEVFLNLKAEAICNLLKADKYDFCCGVTPEESREKIKNNFSVESDEASRLISCEEKPKIVTNNIKGTGFTIFNKNVLKKILENGEENIDLCDCFNYLISIGYNGVVLNIADREFNINTLSDLNEAESCLNN